MIYAMFLEESLRHLDENGIVQIGSEVKAGDVLLQDYTKGRAGIEL